MNGITYIVGLVGETGSGCEITNCYSTCSVNASGNYVGGLVGKYYDATVSNCYSTGSVNGINCIGGLFGFNNNHGTVSNCYSTGSVSGTDYVGGLVGKNYETYSITNCYSTGSVTGYDDFVGGLIGSNYEGTVSNCYSTGSVNGDYCIGGLVGENWYGGAVSNCYSTGSLNGNGRVGGLIGWNYHGTVSNCYSTGSVTGTDYVGGFVGENNGGTVSNSFWDYETSGLYTSSGGECRSTDSMKTQTTFTSAGWNFTTVWQMIGTHYPDLRDNSNPFLVLTYSGGSGTSGNPYIISTLDDLADLSSTSFDWTICFKLSTDIDASSTSGWNDGAGFSPIGNSTTYFTGSYDGDGHTISGLYISSSSEYCGLFGYTNNATISNLGVINVDITAGKYVGGLAGRIASGTVDECYSTGSVNGYDYVGGLVGRNDNYSTITNCYSTCSVTGDDLVGGLVGYNKKTITNCYSTGIVNGTGSSVGGLVGYNYSTITNCYSTGSVTGDDYVGGLVGRNDDIVRECYSTGSVTGDDYVGGLVGRNDDLVRKCYSTGSVNGDYCVGGLVGENRLGSKVLKCYSTGSVIGNDYVGGLVGVNDGTVNNCYSTCSVTGDDLVGGLVGYNIGGGLTKVINSYSIGSVNGSGTVGGLVAHNINGTVSNSFWDYETSGLYTSDGGECRSTDSMKIQSTFIDAGWSPSIWFMDPGAEFNDGYPYLAWQNPSGTPLPVELSSFTASVNKNDVTLKWTTVWEINNAGFDIERQSLAGKKDIWAKIGFVEGNGTTNETKYYTFRDRKLKSGKYNYRLVQRDYNNRSFEHFLTDIVTIGVPKKYAISQNYPNPFNPMTKIDYDLPYDGKVNIVLYDITGRKIATLVNEDHTAGYYTAEFNASHLASGVYFYRIIAKGGENDFIVTKKMMLIK